MILTLNLQCLVMGYGLGIERQVCLCRQMSRDAKYDIFLAHLHYTLLPFQMRKDLSLLTPLSLNMSQSVIGL